MARPERIIFLDIDGPIIPGTRYLENPHCSVEQDLDPRCVMVLHKIIEASGARIVTNSAHNIPHEGLMGAFRQHGLYEHMHPSLKTGYPYEVEPRDASSSTRRLHAIMDWLDEYGGDGEEPPLWVAFDDLPIAHKRACLVDFESGLTRKHYVWAAKYLIYAPPSGATLR